MFCIKRAPFFICEQREINVDTEDVLAWRNFVFLVGGCLPTLVLYLFKMMSLQSGMSTKFEHAPRWQMEYAR